MRTVHQLHAIRWHLENNLIPKLTRKEIDALIELCEKCNAGRLEWDSPVSPKSTLKAGEVLTAYRIELTD